MDIFEQPVYHADLESILTRPLAPETVANYAELALEDTVALIGRIVVDYSQYPTVSYVSSRDNEDAAFGYFSLGNVEEILDSIGNQQTLLHVIDHVIANAQTLDTVIVPPDKSDSAVVPAEGSYIEPTTLPRLKTALYILANEFGVDVRDYNQLEISRGQIKDSMMRNFSYYAIDLPILHRVILVCDEIGNATYVLDRSTMQSFDITVDDITELTKSDLNELIDREPSIGKRIIYSKNFVQNLIYGISSPCNQIQEEFSIEEFEPNQRTYLAPLPPDDFQTLNSISNEVGVAHATVKKAVIENGAEIGSIHYYKFGSKVTQGFSPQQQAYIKQVLESRGLIAAEAPDGYLSIKNMSEQWGVGYTTVKNALRRVGARVGEVNVYRFKTKRSFGYSPEQQVIIEEELKVLGLLGDAPPEGYLSLTGMSKMWGIAFSVIRSALDNISDTIGDVGVYKFLSKPANGYSPEQQAMIMEELTASGFDPTVAPNGYLSINGMHKLWGVSHDTVLKVVESMTDQIGTVAMHRYKNARTQSYSPKQQALILAELTDRGVMTADAPEGYLSMTGMSRLWGVDNHPIHRTILDISDQIGQVGVYRVSKILTYAYSPAQQALVKKELNARGLLADNAPEGYATISDIVEVCKIDHRLLRTIINNILGDLGDVHVYKFNKRNVPGYSPEQQSLIIEAVNTYKDSDARKSKK